MIIQVFSLFILWTAVTNLEVYAHNRIIGGREADIEEFPYQVSIQFDDGFHTCGGSIIHKYIILTAAHCLEDADPKSVTVKTGTSLANRGGKTHGVRKWKKHEDYNQYPPSHDVALILLEKPMKFSKRQKPVKLVTKTPRPNSVGWVTGYGVSEEQNDYSATEETRLMAAEIPLLPLKKCQSLLSVNGGTVTNDMICAGGTTEENKDACQGDRGGPYVINGLQAGIVSWGIGCGSLTVPGVYSSVAAHLKWIMRTKKQLLKGTQQCPSHCYH